MSTLGERIKLIRGTEPQDSFARKAGVSKGSLGGYERDENSPSADAILKICSSANISVTWLLLGTGPMRPGKLAPAPGQEQVPPMASPAARANTTACVRCDALEAKLDTANERLYQASERERDLLKENGELKAKNAALKTENAWLKAANENVNKELTGRLSLFTAAGGECA